jgi:hypothetical protein
MNNNDNEINENKNEEPIQNVEDKKEEIVKETAQNASNSQTSSQTSQGSAEPAIETVKSAASNVLDVLKKAFFTAKEFVQKNLKLVVAALVVLIVVVVGFNVLTRSPKDVAKDYIKALSKADESKLGKLIDFAGIQAFSQCYNRTTYSYDLEDFNENYKDITKDSDEMEKVDEAKDKFLETYGDADVDDLEIKVKEITTSKVKDSSKLTKVKAKVSVKYEDEKENLTLTFYTMKKGLNSYIVGFEDGAASLLSTLAY